MAGGWVAWSVAQLVEVGAGAASFAMSIALSFALSFGLPFPDTVRSSMLAYRPASGEEESDMGVGEEGEGRVGVGGVSECD